MKLHYIKLVGEFKCLKGKQEAPFYYRFYPSGDTYTPLCFVGLNGSGKSNLIELIADIFSYADRYYNSCYNTAKDLDYDFELQYTLKTTSTEKSVRLKCHNSELSILTKSQGEWREVNARQDDHLPDHVVAYSSGQNQGLSSVFAKNQYQMVDVVLRHGRYRTRHDRMLNELGGSGLQREEILFENLIEFHDKEYAEYPHLYADRQPDITGVDPINGLEVIQPDLPRCFYTEHLTNQIIFITLYISKNTRFKHLLKHKLNIDQLLGFEIDLRLSRHKNIPYVKDSVRRLADLAFNANKFNRKSCNGVLEFRLDDEFYEQLEYGFASPEHFYELLHFLSLISAKRWSNDEKRALKTDRYIKNVPTVSGGYTPVRILNTRIKLADSGAETLYDRLSDGEHQLLQVMSIMMMFHKGNALFIMDEPESHFNPQWRSDFVAIVNEYINDRSTEIIVSTHSPFIVSSCKKERVLHFTKSDEGEIEVGRVSMETYGSSFDQLLRRVFDLSVLISKEPLKEIRAIKDRASEMDSTELEEALEKFGPSFEVNYLKNTFRQES